jgi:hypothetical protein
MREQNQRIAPRKHYLPSRKIKFHFARGENSTFARI